MSEYIRMLSAPSNKNNPKSNWCKAWENLSHIIRRAEAERDNVHRRDQQLNARIKNPGSFHPSVSDSCQNWFPDGHKMVASGNKGYVFITWRLIIIIIMKACFIFFPLLLDLTENAYPKQKTSLSWWLGQPTSWLPLDHEQAPMKTMLWPA